MASETWNDILNILEKVLNPGIFKVWVKPLHAQAHGSALEISAPNEFVAAWVRDRLMDSIKDAAAQVMGVRPKVDVKADPAVRNNGGREPGLGGSNGESHGLPIKQDAAPKRFLPERSLWRFRFKDFVPGPCNELAFAASKSLCRNSLPAEQLFLCSGPGLGKTHLLQAIGRRLSLEKNRSSATIACLTAEEFTTRLIMAIKARQVEHFKASLRENVDALLLEDVHFLQGKTRTQDELLSTLKSLNSRGCKVVMTSSFLPRELENVDSQLVSRFCSGFLAVIQKPDLETRRLIIQAKARNLQVAVPDCVANLLAERITTDIRQLESCLHNLIIKARLLNQTLNEELAWQVLNNYALENSSPDVDSIVDFVCKAYGLSEPELKSKSRKRDIVLARNTAFFLARKHTGMSLKSIGGRLGRKHSTVLKGITNVEREISQQTPLGRQLENTIERLG